jgi:Holliday junction DNA helicase RuvB
MNSEKLPLRQLNESIPDSEIRTESADFTLRPRNLSEYVGQKNIVEKLELFIAAARKRKGVLDHVLLSGPPGLGKTTLAHIIAHEMGTRLHLVAAPTLENPGQLMGILTNLQEGDVLFIDEIHRLSILIEETLYPAVELFQAQIVSGEEASAVPITFPLPKFTLVGATTQAGKLTGPLRQRFGISLNLDFYPVEEISKILDRSARLLGLSLQEEEIHAIALRSRGTPRIANRLLARVRDFLEILDADPKTDHIRPELLASVKAQTQGALRGAAAVSVALNFLDVDDKGLQPLDRKYLTVLLKNFRGGPAGIDSIAASLSEDRTTLEEMVEPYLLKEGFIVRTPKGRVATEIAAHHLGLVLEVPLQTPLLRE